jgi:hypothetical protein
MRVNGIVPPVIGDRFHVSNMIKGFITVISLFFFTSVRSQSNYQALAKIDNIVQQIDSLSDKSQRTFYLNKIDKKFNGVKETWHYTLRDGKVIVFQIRYVVDSIEYSEIYYMNKGDLIYSEEYETVYYRNTSNDEIKWGGIYYFVSNNLKTACNTRKNKIQVVLES